MTASVVLNPNHQHGATLSRQQGGLSALQVAACLVGLTLGACGASVAVPLMQSGLAGFQTERALTVWGEKNELPPLELWEQLLDRAELAVAAYPASSGEYLDRLGRVHTWGGIIEPENPVHWRQAAASFREATSVRPHWPWSWLRLAHAKLQLDELDAEFDHALRQAALLGEGRLELNRDFSRMGFTNWQALNIEQRALVLQAAEKVVARSEQHAKDMQQAATAAGLGPALCWAVDASIPTRNQICKEEG